MEYKEICHLGCWCKVNRQGDVYTRNSLNEYEHKEWRYNHDGYPVVSAIGYKNGVKIYRSLQVHILVAKAFIPNPENKPEVNHKDFNRANPSVENLEWTTHLENVRYSRQANRYKDFSGKNNPNYGNQKLHERYKNDKEYAKQKQSRSGGINGKAKKCRLYKHDGFVGEFDYQRGAVKYLIAEGIVSETANLETIIKSLKSKHGYKEYFLYLA